MAWPKSRRTTYVANTTPVVKAADLNAIQDAIVDLYNTATRKLWLPLGLGFPQFDGDWTHDYPGWAAAGASKQLFFHFGQAFASTAGATPRTITRVDVWIDPVGAGTLAVELRKRTAMTTNPATEANVAGPTSTSGNAYQVVSFTGLSLVDTDDVQHFLKITSAATLDVVHGVLLTYTDAAY